MKKTISLTVRQAANLRGVKMQTIYLWLKNGLKYKRKYGLLTVIDKSDLLKYQPNKRGAPFNNRNALGGSKKR